MTKIFVLSRMPKSDLDIWLDKHWLIMSVDLFISSRQTHSAAPAGLIQSHSISQTVAV